MELHTVKCLISRSIISAGERLSVQERALSAAAEPSRTISWMITVVGGRFRKENFPFIRKERQASWWGPAECPVSVENFANRDFENHQSTFNRPLPHSLYSLLAPLKHHSHADFKIDQFGGFRSYGLLDRSAAANPLRNTANLPRNAWLPRAYLLKASIWWNAFGV